MRLFLAALLMLAIFPMNFARVHAVEVDAKKLTDVTEAKLEEHGLVVLARPLLSQMTPNDPVRIAIHFATPTGPIDHTNEKFGQAMVERFTSLQSFEIALRKAGGTWERLKPEAKDGDAMNITFVAGPTFLLELRPDALVLLNEQGNEEASLPWSWKGEMVPGKVEVAVRGKLFLNWRARKVTKDGVSEDLPASRQEVSFRSLPVAIQVDRVDMTNQSLVELQAAAVKALTDKVKDNGEELTVVGTESIPISDEKGNRVIRVRANLPPPKPDVAMIAGGNGYWQYEVVMSPAGKPVSFGRARKGFCLAVGTQVATPDGDRKIETLRPGMLVWAREEATGKKVIAEVQAVQSSRTSETLVVNESLRLTAEHPVFARSDKATYFAWVPASTIAVGDELLSGDESPVKVTSIKIIAEPIEVLDIAVSGPHNFFAAGVLVHNKSVVWTPDFFVPWYSLWRRAAIE